MAFISYRGLHSAAHRFFFNLTSYKILILSINRSLFIAKSSAEKGQVNRNELRDLVIQAINDVWGRIDYAEARLETIYSKI